MDCTVATHKQAVQEQPPAGYEFQNVVLGVTCTPICSMFSEPAGGSQIDKLYLNIVCSSDFSR